MSVVSDFLKVASNPPSFCLENGQRIAGITTVDKHESPLYILSGYLSSDDAYNFGVWLIKNFGERRYGECNEDLLCLYFPPSNQ